jgi:hypothetical protein
LNPAGHWPARTDWGIIVAKVIGSMTPPESNVDAWITAQETFFAAQREAVDQEDEQTPLEEPPAQVATIRKEPDGDFWQSWFGLWR